MVVEIDPFVHYHYPAATSTITGQKVRIFKLTYFFTLSTKINEVWLPHSTFYAKSYDY